MNEATARRILPDKRYLIEGDFLAFGVAQPENRTSWYGMKHYLSLSSITLIDPSSYDKPNPKNPPSYLPQRCKRLAIKVIETPYVAHPN